MFKIMDFNIFPRNTKHYGGDAGQKLGIDIDGERWLLKFPKSKVDLEDPQVSYTTSPLSEYLGSHIYATFGIPVHETMLGIRDGKLVVACKDFEVEGLRFTEFKSIKNTYIPAIGDSVTSGSGTNLEEILTVLKLTDVTQEIPGLEERFWDMFLVDFFIHNNDRNNTNWGVLQDVDYRYMGLAPVFDNGNAFSNKRGQEVFASRIEDRELLREDSYKTFTNTFLDAKGHHIHPAAYIMNTDNTGCINALERFSERISWDAIEDVFDEVPLAAEGMPVMSEVQKSYYQQMMKMALDDVLMPAYEKHTTR